MIDQGFADRLLERLRAFAADLVDPVRTPGQAAAANQGLSPISILLGQVDHLERLLPALVEEAATSVSTSRYELVASPIPRDSEPRFDPSDYVVYRDRIVPRRFYRAEPVPEIDARPLAWLLAVIETLASHVETARARLGRQVDDVRRDAGGYFAQRVQQQIEDFWRRVDTAPARLARSARAVLEAASWRIHATTVAPAPYPSGAAWQRLRALASAVFEPGALALPLASELLHCDAGIADLPFLYQRWCGVEIVRTLADFGLTARDNPLPALLLGGRIGFAGRDLAIDLWCEPMLARNATHASGLVCLTKAESSPDYVLIVPGEHGNDAFVLDPTLSSDPDVRANKASYLGKLALPGLSRIAGVPVKLQRRPLRAWAAAPLAADHCVLLGADGATGTVPMHPDGSRAPLAAWLGDVVRHARAWAARAQ